MKISSLKNLIILKKKKSLKITKNIDDICNNTRAYSHTLLPPNFNKNLEFKLPLKDMFENYKTNIKI